MNLTHLEGFTPTELEQLVAGNSAFEELRQSRWPLQWGKLTTGRSVETEDQDGRRRWAETAPLLPRRAGILSHKTAALEHKVRILAARIARDADLSIPENKRLLEDLSLWQDCPTFRGFRWEEHQQQLDREAKHQAWETEVSKLKQGTANVIVLLLTRLLHPERTQLRDTLFEHLVARGLFGRWHDDEEKQWYHMPPTHCYACGLGQYGSLHHTKGEYRDCEQTNAIVLVDCGSVAEVMSGIERTVQRYVTSVRFVVPRSTFGAYPTRQRILPTMVVHGLNLLDSEEQERYVSDQTLLLKSCQNSYGGTSWRASTLLEPAGKQRLNAVLLAGPAATSAYGRLSQTAELLSTWDKELLKEQRLTITRLADFS